MNFAAILLASALTVQVVADPDGPLEPSIMNEVEYALGRVSADAVGGASSATNATAALGDVFGTNGLSATEIAVKLVSRQDRAGRWIVNGTNATSEAVAILTFLTGGHCRDCQAIRAEGTHPLRAYDLGGAGENGRHGQAADCHPGASQLRDEG